MLKIATILFIIAAVAVVASGCSQPSSRGDSGPPTPGLETPQSQGHKELTIDEFKARLKANPKARLVDVRSEPEYRDGHLEGAIVIPLEQIASKAETLLGRNEEILLYCHNGPMGTDAAKILTSRGYTTVANLQGGINGWQRMGLPLVK